MSVAAKAIPTMGIIEMIICAAGVKEESTLFLREYCPTIGHFLLQKVALFYSEPIKMYSSKYTAVIFPSTRFEFTAVFKSSFILFSP